MHFPATYWVVKQSRLIRAWVPLAALLVAVGGAGVLGGIQAAGQAVPTVASILSATRQANTARYEASSITTSADPLLRSTSTTFAEVDFQTGDSQSTTTQHSLGRHQAGSGPIQVQAQTFVDEERQVAGQEYLNLAGSSGLPAVEGYWIKSPKLPGQPTTGLIARLGPEYLGLLALPPNQLTIVRQGSTILHGVQVTAYLVEPTSALSRCTSVQFSSNGQPVQTEMWVDTHQRLQAVRTSVSYVVKQPKNLPPLATRLGPVPRGRMTITTDLHIQSFGSPVRVVVPPLSRGGYSSSLIEVGRSGCPKGRE